MTAKDLFGVGVRLIGLVAVMMALPELLHLNYLGAGPGVAGLILITRAELIAHLCYPQHSREKAFKDFRES